MPYICLTCPEGCVSCTHPRHTLDVTTCPAYDALWVPQDEVISVVDLLHRLFVSDAAIVLRFSGETRKLEVCRQDGALVCGPEGGPLDRRYVDFHAFYTSELAGMGWEF